VLKILGKFHQQSSDFSEGDRKVLASSYLLGVFFSERIVIAEKFKHDKSDFGKHHFQVRRVLLQISHRLFQSYTPLLR